MADILKHRFAFRKSIADQEAPTGPQVLQEIRRAGLDKCDEHNGGSSGQEQHCILPAGFDEALGFAGLQQVTQGNIQKQSHIGAGKEVSRTRPGKGCCKEKDKGSGSIKKPQDHLPGQEAAEDGKRHTCGENDGGSDRVMEQIQPAPGNCKRFGTEVWNRNPGESNLQAETGKDKRRNGPEEAEQRQESPPVLLRNNARDAVATKVSISGHDKIGDADFKRIRGVFSPHGCAGNFQDQEKRKDPEQLVFPKLAHEEVQAAQDDERNVKNRRAGQNVLMVNDDINMMEQKDAGEEHICVGDALKSCLRIQDFPVHCFQKVFQGFFSFRPGFPDGRIVSWPIRKDKIQELSDRK